MVSMNYSTFATSDTVQTSPINISPKPWIGSISMVPILFYHLMGQFVDAELIEYLGKSHIEKGSNISMVSTNLLHFPCPNLTI